MKTPGDEGMAGPVFFYRQGDAYGEFSNFSAHPIEIAGCTWPTTEHFFQAQKFPGTPHAEEIRRAKSPGDAARMGRERSRPLRADWERVKDGIMYDALRAKFTQHARLRRMLLSTADRVLIEHTRNDHYWADGGDGTGLNRLGELLMRLRAEMRAAPAAEPPTADHSAPP